MVVRDDRPMVVEEVVEEASEGGLCVWDLLSCCGKTASGCGSAVCVCCVGVSGRLLY